MTGTRSSKSGGSNPNLVVSYVRVSTDLERQHLGADSQTAAIQEWCSKSGLTIARSFVETVSGGAPLDKRPILMEAIATVSTLGASGLVVHRLDRFSRDGLTAAIAETELRKHGASVLCADGTANGDDPTSTLIRSILLSVAQWEKSLIRARIKCALQLKRSRGERVGAPPYGYKVEGKNLVPHPEEMATKERLREMRAAGLTLQKIRELATEQGLRNRFGRPFNLASIHAIVRPASIPPAE